MREILTASEYSITDASHKIRVDVMASAGPGEDDGYLGLYIDDVLKEVITGIDNDTVTYSSVCFRNFRRELCRNLWHCLF